MAVPSCAVVTCSTSPTTAGSGVVRVHPYGTLSVACVHPNEYLSTASEGPWKRLLLTQDLEPARPQNKVLFDVVPYVTGSPWVELQYLSDQC